MIRAFETAGIPIDIIGGTSMGALIGSGVGLGLGWAEIGDRFRRAFVDDNPVNDYTLPLVSLARGRKMTRILRDQCETNTIENLWRTFFAVSANLSTGRIMVHQQGPLWHALRATAAIPGIVPPFILNNDVLVDGGIMNNFPADVMNSLARGPVVGAEVSVGVPFYAKVDDLDNKSLMWRLRNRSDVVPSLIRILVRCATVNSEAQSELSRAAVDVLIQPRLEGIDMLSFKSFDTAIELGYRATMERFENTRDAADLRNQGAALLSRAACDVSPASHAAVSLQAGLATPSLKKLKCPIGPPSVAVRWRSSRRGLPYQLTISFTAAAGAKTSPAMPKTRSGDVMRAKPARVSGW